MVCVDWSKLQVGDTIDIVCETVLLACDGRNVMKQCGSGNFFVLHGCLQDLVNHWTIFNAKVVEGKFQLALSIDDETVFHVHSPMQFEHVGQCIELGAGGGFMSLGFKEAGFEIFWLELTETPDLQRPIMRMILELLSQVILVTQR